MAEQSLVSLWFSNWLLIFWLPYTVHCFTSTQVTDARFSLFGFKCFLKVMGLFHIVFHPLSLLTNANS